MCNQAGGQPDPHIQEPGIPALLMLPYNCYPSPNMYFLMHPPPWMHGIPVPPSGFPPTTMPAHPYPVVIQPTKLPAIAEWLWWCDHQPDCQGAALESLAWKFEQEGYRSIDQLARMSVRELSSWFTIGKGMADLLIKYASDDMELICNGTFKMELVPGSSDQWSIRDL